MNISSVLGEISCSIYVPVILWFPNSPIPAAVVQVAELRVKLLVLDVPSSAEMRMAWKIQAHFMGK